LSTLAAHCQSLAVEVGAMSTSPELSLPSGQATAVAVAEVHADVSVAGTALVDRLESTSAKLAASAVSFTDQESDSAAEVAGITSTTAF
jgi:hypothetical protein